MTMLLDTELTTPGNDHERSVRRRTNCLVENPLLDDGEFERHLAEIARGHDCVLKQLDGAWILSWRNRAEVGRGPDLETIAGIALVAFGLDTGE
jgi:hypothetical protein